MRPVSYIRGFLIRGNLLYLIVLAAESADYKTAPQHPLQYLQDKDQHPEVPMIPFRFNHAHDNQIFNITQIFREVICSSLYFCCVLFTF